MQEDTSGVSIPWMKFLTCVPLWAILIAQCGQSWLFYTQLTELPTYMHNILHFDIISVSTLYQFVFILSINITDVFLCNLHSYLHLLYTFDALVTRVPILGLLISFFGFNICVYVRNIYIQCYTPLSRTGRQASLCYGADIHLSPY